MYKVVVGTLWVDGVKYCRGDTVKLTAEQAATHGVRVELAEKPKRTRKKKAETNED